MSNFTTSPTAISLGSVMTLTGNSGGAVSPDGGGNINVLGDTTTINITGNPGTNTLTANVTGGTNGQLLIAATAGNPAWASLASADSSIVFTAGANTLDLSVNAAASGAVVDFVPDSGTSPVVPDGTGTITLTGGTTGLTFVGGLNSLTLSSTLIVANGGTGATTLTDGGILLGSGVGAVTVTAQPTNGQLLIGSTGVDPVLATLASADSSVTISNGAGTIDLSVNAAAAGAVVDFIPDSGTSPVVPDGTGTVTITGGTTGLTFVGGLNSLTQSGTLVVGNGGTGATSLTDGGILLGSGTGAVTVTAQPTNGQLLIGSTGVDPVLATLASADASVTITNGAGTIDLSVVPGVTWSVETGASVAGAVNRGYIANRAGLVTITLPDTAAVGSIIRVTGINTAVGWRIAQNAGETIYFGTSATTTGVGGYIEATNIRDSVEIVCVVADTDWNVLNSVGNITIV